MCGSCDQLHIRIKSDPATLRDTMQCYCERFDGACIKPVVQERWGRHASVTVDCMLQTKRDLNYEATTNPIEYETFTRRWLKVDPSSDTVAQH